MSWLDFKISKDPSGELSLTSKINGELSSLSTWRIREQVEDALVKHYTRVFIDAFANEIVNEISPEKLMTDVREAFRENLKDKLKGSI